jgi:hypothetical protein|tara:strand:+ start:31 stop:192 length:162 start_codon:yes stop_codon:yes gene_type:complete
MIDLLLYASMNCQDAADIMVRIKRNDNVSQIVQAEVVEVLKEATPECNWDAND